MADISRCTVIVLAAQRTGVVNPLASRAGVSHKCLAPIAGTALINHVMDVIAASPEVAKVRVMVEPDGQEALAPLLAPYRDRGLAVDLVSSAENIVESVLLGAQGQDAPFIVTTADNVLLTRKAFVATLGALETHDAAMNLAAKPSVQAIHPEAQRRFYEFRDEGYANCNLYGIAGPHAFGAAEVFREGGQFMKNPKRLITAFGLFNIFLFRFKLLTLQSAVGRMSKRFGVNVAALVPDDGAQAVDVDNERTYEVAEMVLKQRAAAGS
ncbi:MAG: NTP transferase domain-containing protein [Sphingomonadaceae bacterium]|nr:NTP transferase domain-containing protein [Sphingomonadaceae bacterium]